MNCIAHERGRIKMSRKCCCCNQMPRPVGVIVSPYDYNTNPYAVSPYATGPYAPGPCGVSPYAVSPYAYAPNYGDGCGSKVGCSPSAFKFNDCGWILLLIFLFALLLVFGVSLGALIIILILALIFIIFKLCCFC